MQPTHRHPLARAPPLQVKDKGKVRLYVAPWSLEVKAMSTLLTDDKLKEMHEVCVL